MSSLIKRLKIWNLKRRARALMESWIRVREYDRGHTLACKMFPRAYREYRQALALVRLAHRIERIA